MTFLGPSGSAASALLSILFLLVLWSPSLAQDRPRKEAQAVRVSAGAIRVDGRLDEQAWNAALPLTDFVQKEPTEGAPASDRIEVRFAYDDSALYVGARMDSTTSIQAPLGRRDEGDQAEHLHISLDTYLDRRTASTFGVTATGVRLDFYHASDDDWNDDETFNPVWQARTSIDEQGWIAELWIPFSQLRFNDRSPQVWGLNVRRWIPSRNEDVFWSPVLRTDERWASLFGNLTGIDGIRPRRRLELLPYVAGNSRVAGDRHSGDPFVSAANLEARAGADLKMGFGSNLTLEATVNPDFGQVEADPAEVNLSAFETFFAERRPFFVEGANLLSGRVNNYFYSRRIGAAPAGRASGDFVEYPATTTILGAAKLTGRLPSGTSIGMLGALTDDESARIFSNLQFGRVRVAPRTTYGVARVEQELGPPGSTVGLMATTVHRDLPTSDPLTSLLTRNAFTLSGDSVMRFGDYELQSYLGVTHVDGEPAVLQRLQRSSARYFQRPGVNYIRFDPLRTSMSGGKGGVTFERQNARHWMFEVEAAFESPEFETNDLGRLSTGDGIMLNGELEYQETTPSSWYRQYSFTLGQQQEWNYGGDRQTSRITSEASVTLPNFWEAELNTTHDLERQDMRLTRGGPSMERPASWRTTLEVQSSPASQTRGNGVMEYGRSDDGGLFYSSEVGLTMQPGPQWQLSITPKYEREVETQQYVTTLSGGRPETFGGRYIFGHIDRSTYATQLRLNYTFKPDLTVDFYGEPFAASGRYSGLGELLAARGRVLLPVNAGELNLEDELDFSVRSFRSNLVLRWEWRPGSTMYLVWQQDRHVSDRFTSRASVSEMFRSFRARGDHFFAVKISYWLSPS